MTTEIKYHEICYYASKNGMINDPRISYDFKISGIINEGCGFQLRDELKDCPEIPKVCGNCKWYSVQ
jgi:hypothetical protein